MATAPGTPATTRQGRTIYLSDLLGRPITDSRGESLGRVDDVVVRLPGSPLPAVKGLVAKVGGNAKVYTRAQYSRFLARYFRRNPGGTFGYLLDTYLTFLILPGLGARARSLGVRKPLELIYRALLGDPVSR